MSKILIKNAIIVTMDSDRKDNVVNGDIFINNGFIEAVDVNTGTNNREMNNNMSNNMNNNIDNKLKYENCRVIDGSGFIVMPGLVNTHGHAAMSLFRSFADDIPLMRWLEEKIFPAEERLTADDVYWGTMLSIVEMIRSGTTTFTDMYFFMDKVAQATEETGIRAVLSRGMVGPDDEEQNRLKEIKSFYNCWNGAAEERIRLFLGPHAIYTCPPDSMDDICGLADELKSPLQIHLCETRIEVENCLKEYGGTPVEVLARTGLFEHQVICAHCVHLTENDIDILARYKTGIAHNPGSNLKLGSGIAPLPQMLNSGLKVGLGTDGPASNNNLDMFEEMRLAALIHKGINEDPTYIPARTALMMATSMGAEALFLPKIGKIKEGYRADIIGIAKNKAHLIPLHDVEAHLVYSASGSDVEMVMVNGRLLLENRDFLSIDEERILYEAQKCASRLVSTQ